MTQQVHHVVTGRPALLLTPSQVRRAAAEIEVLRLCDSAHRSPRFWCEVVKGYSTANTRLVLAEFEESDS